jgi:hypothetical protein
MLRPQIAIRRRRTAYGYAVDQPAHNATLGVCKRTDTSVRQVVLADSQPFTPLCVECAGARTPQLWIKETRQLRFSRLTMEGADDISLVRSRCS